MICTAMTQACPAEPIKANEIRSYTTTSAARRRPKDVGREGHRADPIADIVTTRRPAGAAAITSRTQHPARSVGARQVLGASKFNWQLYDRHSAFVFTGSYLSPDVPLPV